MTGRRVWLCEATRRVGGASNATDQQPVVSNPYETADADSTAAD
jgi:hypothetical protein